MIKLALRNILRQKMHTAMTLTAIVFGVSGLIVGGGWVDDVFVQLAEALIHSQSGHAQIYKKGFYAEGSRSPEKYLIPEPDKIKQVVKSFSEVDDAMVRLNFSALLNNGRSDLPVVGEGVEAAREARLGSFLSITSGRQLSEGDDFGALIGFGVAQALQLKPGDRVTMLANTLEGALNSLDLEVVGIFQTFSKDYDARAVKIPLSAAQELLGRNSANAIVLSLRNTQYTDQVVARLKKELEPAGLELRTWIELNDFYEKTVELYKRQFGFLQLIILVMVVLSVTNNVNMSVFERVGEFGTMMSLGNRRGQIFRLILTESVLLGLIGSVLGEVLGVLLALAISSVGIPMPPPPNANLGYRAEIQIVATTLLTSFSIGLGATILASVFPALRVSRTPVVEALRSNV